MPTINQRLIKAHGSLHNPDGTMADFCWAEEHHTKW